MPHLRVRVGVEFLPLPALHVKPIFSGIARPLPSSPSLSLLRLQSSRYLTSTNTLTGALAQSFQSFLPATVAAISERFGQLAGHFPVISFRGVKRGRGNSSTAATTDLNLPIHRRATPFFHRELASSSFPLPKPTILFAEIPSQLLRGNSGGPQWPFLALQIQNGFPRPPNIMLAQNQELVPATGTVGFASVSSIT